MEKLPIVNFDVTETWTMICPHCDHTSEALFNDENPMQPEHVICEECRGEFILTFDRD